MAHPCHYYIKFIALQEYGDNDSPESVNETLQSFGLPPVLPNQFENIVEALDPPKGFDFESKEHAATIRFMREEQVYALWVDNPDDLDAVRIINTPQVRETIQLLLLGGFSANEIRSRVRVKYRKDFSSRTLGAFRHYFWNVDLIDGKDLANLMARHPMRDAFLAAMYGSKSQALFRAGFNPAIDARKALREAHRSLALRLEATRRLPDSKETVRMLTSLSAGLINVHTALHSEGAGIEDMMKDLQKFIMERDAPNVVPISKLAPNKNYSFGGKKTGEAE